MTNLLCDLISATLTGKPLTLDGATQEDWEGSFDLALQQQVAAMMFPTMMRLAKESRPPFLLWSKWMAYAQGVAEQS